MTAGRTGRFVGWVAGWVAAATVLLTAALGAAAQTVLPSEALKALGVSAPPAPQPSASAPSPDDLAARLAESRAAHQLLEAEAAGSEAAPLLEDRRRVSARLIMVLSARLQQARAGAVPLDPRSLAAGVPESLRGAPPYPVTDVDTLRDQRDGLMAEQAALTLAIRTLDAEIDALLQVLRRAEEQVRLRLERRDNPRTDDSVPQLQSQLDLARLQARVAEQEGAQANEARQIARTRLAQLAEPIAELDRVIARVRTAQQFDETELATIRRAVADERVRINADRRRLLDQIAARESAAPSSIRDRELESMRDGLASLGELEMVERGREDVWRHRQAAAAAAAAGAGPAREVGVRLARAYEQAEGRRRLAEERVALTRAAARAQQARLTQIDADDPDRAAEERVLRALQTEAVTHERVQDTLARLTTLLQRSRDDLGVADNPADARGWLEKAAADAVYAARSIWNFELFATTDTTVVDGQSVTVDYGVTVGKSVGVVVLFVIGYWLAGRVATVVIHQMERKLHLSPQVGRVLRRWVMSILVLVVLLIVLKVARIPLTAFAFLGGALAIGVGFGAQNVIKNLISGIIILFERKVRVGDIVTIAGSSGTVTSVDLRATTVRGFDGIESIVPNSTLLENQVSNWSYGTPVVRRDFNVGVAYGSDVRRAAALIQAAVKAHPAVLADPAPEVLFADFGADALVLRLLYWVNLKGPRSGPAVDSDLRFAIDDAMRDAGITIAYPQRDVHLDVTAPVPVRMVDPAPQDPG